MRLQVRARASNDSQAKRWTGRAQISLDYARVAGVAAAQLCSRFRFQLGQANEFREELFVRLDMQLI